MPCGFPPFGKGTFKRIFKDFMKNTCTTGTLTRYVNGTWMVGPRKADSSNRQTAAQTVKPVSKTNKIKLKNTQKPWTIFWYCVYSSILGISLALNVFLYMTLLAALTK